MPANISSPFLASSQNMVEGVGRGIDFAFGYFWCKLRKPADGAGDPPTVAPTFEKDCRRACRAYGSFGIRDTREPGVCLARSWSPTIAVIRLVGHAQNHFRRPSHGACYRTRLASGWPIIVMRANDGVLIPARRFNAGGRDPVEFRMAVEPGAQGLVRRFVKNQRQRFGQNLGDGHAKAASALNIGCH